jgi:hypothetical protein
MASRTVWRRFLSALVLGLAEAAAAFVLAAVVTTPTAAEQFDDRFPFLEERARRGGTNNGGLFGDERRSTRSPTEYNSKAPPPTHKSDSVPLTSVVVLGDSMADWLAYGLEQAAADSPDIGILRRHRTFSGLIHIEVKSDPHGEYPDWPQVAREVLSADKANFVVMMIGLNDRRPIHEKAPAKSATPSATHDKAAEKKDGEKDNVTNEEEPSETPEGAASEHAAPGMVTYEFRSEKWTELYIKRIDETIAALKSKNVPVFWVGLPPVRNTKTSADLSFLNDLYRSRAEKAGITYIDTWDGFVDESGRFVMQGPDFEGQIRRLRSGDGTHFTAAGARKLAHYVEREIQRALMANATPVTLPAADEPAATPQTSAPRPGAAMARPLAGPVMPLTTPAEASELVGGAGAHQVASDALAARVLVRGDPDRAPAGRADDFAWPRRPVAAVGADPVVATTTIPMTPMKSYEEPHQVASAPAAAAPNSPAAPAPVHRVAPVRQARAPSPPPQPRRIAPAPQPFFFPFFH